MPGAGFQVRFRVQGSRVPPHSWRRAAVIHRTTNFGPNLDLEPADRKKVLAMPDPEPLRSFAEAVKTRKQAGGHAEAAHRCATLLHLANIAIRTGRKICFDPAKEQIVGDEEANRLVNQPMRAPWHL